MASYPDLYQIPAGRLDAFVTQQLQPDVEWKEEVEDAFKRVERFLRDQCFHTQLFLDREVRLKRVVKVRRARKFWGVALHPVSTQCGWRSEAG